MEVVKGVIETHKEKFKENPTAPKEDFIDCYLEKIQSGKEPTCTGIQTINF